MSLGAHFPALKGQFVNLRPLRIDDAELTLAWRTGNRASLLNQGAVTVDDQAAWIMSRPDEEFNFIIETAVGRPVGMLSLVDVDLSHSRAEPARFLIGDEEAVKGIPAAVEAMSLIYEFAFDSLGLRRIYGTVASSNHLMIKWQRYLGMSEEGRLRNHYFINGQVQDAVCLGMLEDEYRSIALPRMKSLIALGKKR